MEIKKNMAIKLEDIKEKQDERIYTPPIVTEPIVNNTSIDELLQYHTIQYSRFKTIGHHFTVVSYRIKLNTIKSIQEIDNYYKNNT